MEQITRRAFVASLLSAAGTLGISSAIASEPIKRSYVDELPLFVSELLNWDGTTDEEWTILASLVERFMKENPDALAAIAMRAEALKAGAADGTLKPDVAIIDTSGFEEVGDFDFYIACSGGTSQDGNVPTMVVEDDTVAAQISVCISDGDGSECQILYDGIEIMRRNLGRSQSTVTLSDSQLAPGMHIIELIQMGDGEKPVAYKKASLEISR